MNAKTILRSKGHSLSFRVDETAYGADDQVLVNAVRLTPDGRPNYNEEVRDFSCNLRHGIAYLNAARRAGFKYHQLQTRTA